LEQSTVLALRNRIDNLPTEDEMKFKMFFAALALSLAFASQSRATTIDTAKKLADACSEMTNPNRDINSAYALGMCQGYVIGLLDGVVGMSIEIKGEFFDVILADNATYGQCARVFIKYVHEHPDVENKPSLDVMTNALLDAKLLGVKPHPRPVVTQ
jgi:hypothetical protein